MRYCKIVLEHQQKSTTSTNEINAKGGKKLTFNTHPNGVHSAPDPGALHTIIDVPVTTFEQPNGTTYVEVRGIDIATISQASNLQGYTIKVYGGMGVGYPLAKPAQSGLLLTGVVYQAYGNWVGTEMSLNLLVQPFNEAITTDDPPKFVWHWAQGQDIKDAINKCLTDAMPGYTCEFNLSSTMTGTHDDLGYYSDFASIADIIMNASLSVNKTSGYNGIRFFVVGKKFYVFDNSTGSTAKKIEFTDLIGQPTWLGPVQNPRIMLQTVMRADIAINDVITMPLFNQTGSHTLAGYGTIAPSSTEIQTGKGRSLFQGNFQVLSIRHIGDSRNPDGTAWVTVIEAVKT